MDTYFLGILDYEQKKADAGLFMSDEACLKVIEGCEVCLLYTSPAASSAARLIL